MKEEEFFKLLSELVEKKRKSGIRGSSKVRTLEYRPERDNPKEQSEHMKKHHPGVAPGIEYMDWHDDMPEPKIETLPNKNGEELELTRKQFLRNLRKN